MHTHASRLLPAIALLAAFLGCSPRDHTDPSAPAERLDILVEGGRVLVGRELRAQNVGVRGDRIVYVGKERPLAARTIHAQGRVVAPGFIDVNTVGSPNLSAELLKLRDGTTSYLSAHGNPRDAIEGEGCLNRAFTLGLNFAGEPELEERYLEVTREALERGFYGVSISPEYHPAAFTPERIEALCRDVGAVGALLSFHTRFSSAPRELEGIAEALACAEHGGQVHILHLNSTGGAFDPRAALAQIEAARAAGARVEFDFYPFTYWKSKISWKRFEGDWKNRYQVAWRQVQLADDPSLPLDESAFHTAARSAPDRYVFVESIPRATIDLLALESEAPIGTDTNPVSFSSHPRGAASFATFFRDYVQTEKISLEAALYRFSTGTAERFSDVVPGLRDRGRIEVGKVADLIVLDPEGFRPRASRGEPLRASEGVHSALVRGKALLLEGRLRLVDCPEAGRILPGRVRPATPRPVAP